MKPILVSVEQYNLGLGAAPAVGLTIVTGSPHPDQISTLMLQNDETVRLEVDAVERQVERHPGNCCNEHLAFLPLEAPRIILHARTVIKHEEPATWICSVLHDELDSAPMWLWAVSSDAGFELNLVTYLESAGLVEEVTILGIGLDCWKATSGSVKTGEANLILVRYLGGPPDAPTDRTIWAPDSIEVIEALET